MLDILYISYNRLELTRESFQALVDNTDWEHVSRLYIHDDESTDGTREWLDEAADSVPREVVFSNKKMGGPVAATNWYLNQSWQEYKEDRVDRFAKIDNDFIVCPGWLTEVLKRLTAMSDVDVFGFEPMTGPAIMPPFPDRGIRTARFVGGKVIVRHRAFQCCQPAARGRQGWTQWQTSHESIRKVWVYPDLPCFGLDQIPFEPWATLTRYYTRKQWGRAWEPYPAGMDTYWGWWEPVHMNGFDLKGLQASLEEPE